MGSAPVTGGARFRTTHWSVVLAANGPRGPEATEALETLCRAYWYPLYAYTRRRGYSVEESQDLTQQFFVQLLEKHWLEQVDRRKGRFRCFLLAALKHFLANEWRRVQAVKRGGGILFLSLDDTAEARFAREPTSDSTPEKEYERGWALILFDRALQRLRSQFEASGKLSNFELLKDYLWREGGEPEYRSIAQSLATTPGAVSVAVHRFRGHYRDLVREEVAETVDDPSGIEDEVRSLLAALKSS
jgi:DNA-directed RNA polymerase specialized sigma24 family protein